MMPLAPERNTLYMASKPKADFSIDFIVGNAKKSNNNNNTTILNNNNASPPRKGSASPLSARRASPPRYADDIPRTSRSPDSVEDEDEVRARLLGLQAAALPGPGALHGLLPPGTLGLPLGLGMPRTSPGQPSPASPGSPLSPRSPASPPQSPPHHPGHPGVSMSQHPPPFLFRSLYRPEPMLVPPQFQLQQQLLAQQEGLASHLPPHLAPHMSMQPVPVHGPHHPPHPGHPGHPGGPVHPHHPPNAPPKDSYPLYPWLLSRHGRIFPHRFPGGPDFAGFLLHPFRKPKRIRTAFSPSQLLKLEHAFENNHYVVGAERKQVAQALGLSETQVKVWFQNRRTKHKRTEQEEEAKAQRQVPGSSTTTSSTTTTSSSLPSPASSHKWQQGDDDRSPESPGSPGPLQRPVDLSSQDDSSGTEA